MVWARVCELIRQRGCRTNSMLPPATSAPPERPRGTASRPTQLSLYIDITYKWPAPPTGPECLLLPSRIPSLFAAPSDHYCVHPTILNLQVNLCGDSCPHLLLFILIWHKHPFYLSFKFQSFLNIIMVSTFFLTELIIYFCYLFFWNRITCCQQQASNICTETK